MFESEAELYEAAADIGERLHFMHPEASSAWWTSYVVELAKWMAVQGIVDLKGEAPHPDLLNLIWDGGKWPFE